MNAYIKNELNNKFHAWLNLSMKTKKTLFFVLAFILMVTWCFFYLIPTLQIYEKINSIKLNATTLQDQLKNERKFLNMEKESFLKLQKMSSKEIERDSLSPSMISKISDLAGPAFSGISVDHLDHWPRASMNNSGWSHLIELRLSGSWEDIARAVNSVEKYSGGTAVELTMDISSDQQIALIVQWEVNSPYKELTSKKSLT